MDYEIFKLHHRGMDCIGVRLSREDSRNVLIRKIPGIRWSQTNKCWYWKKAAVGSGGRQIDEEVAAAIGSGVGQIDEEVAAAIGSGVGQIDEEVAAAIGRGSGQIDEDSAAVAVGSGGRQVDEEVAVAVGRGDSQVYENAAAAIESVSGQQVDEGAKGKVVLDASVMAAVKKFTEHMRVVRYAENSIQNYIGAIMEFLKFFVGKDWKHLNADDMQRFQKERIIDRNLSYAYQNTMISAIKQFYEVNTGKAVDPDFIKRPRKGRPLPNIFSLEQVSTLIKSVRNEKHRVMLSIGYGCGLRSGEVVKLKPEDIKTDLGMLFVLKSKGNKDRMVPISANLISQLREYFKIYRPKVWLFEGEKEGEHYSQRSLQMVFRKAVERCKFPSKHKFHDLRHSYATHLMDAGTNQHVIQKILGHNDIRTTEIYTHVSKTLLQRVYNPFDNLNL